MLKKETKLVSVRVPLDIAEWIQSRATNNVRTVSGEIVSIIKDCRNCERNKIAPVVAATGTQALKSITN
ncbi:hypothetical protein [Eikenella exigua]|uniref:Arc-like DNA binding domain-containing protein n=1 Tax=Eikenella exigua TaxID=2528037 RepID=A0AAX1F8A9_9NEIS|nr:hypothetical protein [Eikenella exigua]QED92307.1 hypothetical protein EZJ17_06575 [Eikenella exigua]